jgi:hypothetical protein
LGKSPFSQQRGSGNVADDDDKIDRLLAKKISLFRMRLIVIYAELNSWRVVTPGGLQA